MTQQIIQWVTPAVEHLHMAGYWIALLAAFLETLLGVGLLLPGSTLILLLGALSARGYMDVGDLIWFAVVGAIIGDNVNYHLGKKFGTRWTREGVWFLKKEHFEKATAFFERHGAKSVFWGRFIPSVKELVPFVAGLASMRTGPFMIWNILGGIGWGLQWVLTGYVFAESLTLAKVWMSRMGFLAIIALVLVLVFYLIRRLILKHGRQLLAVAGSMMHSIKEAVARNPHVVKMVQHYPRVFNFMARRLDRTEFRGLPLTLLGISFVYLLILFGGIVEDFLAGDPIVTADLNIANLLITFRTPHLTRFFLWITVLGKWQAILAFSIAFIVVLWLWGRRYYVAAFLTTLVGSQVFTQLGKLAFHRPRPAFPVYLEHSYSFPSGHATVAVAFYGFLAYVLIHQTTKWRAKVNYFLAATLFILMIGMSRLYLDVHYLSDVWTGYLVGAMWLVIGIALSRYWEANHPQTDGSAPNTKTKRVWAGVVIGLALIFYVGFAAAYHPELLTAPVANNHPTTIAVPEDIFPKAHLKYTESLTGEKELPINLVIYAKDDTQVTRAFLSAGWLRADKIGLRSLIRDFRSVFSGSAYASAPMRPMFWDARTNDFCFERSSEIKDSKARRVVRLWKTPYVAKSGYSVYIGQVSLTSNLISELTHRISLDLDSQRDFLCRNLVQEGGADHSRNIQLAKPSSGQNEFEDPFVTDGRACVLEFIQRP